MSSGRDPRVAEIDDRGVVRALHDGTVCITVTIQGRSRCANLRVVGSPSNSPRPVITVTGLPAAIRVGESAQPAASLAGAPPAPVVWGAHWNAVAVGPDGKLSALRPGTVTVSTTISNVTVQHAVVVNP